MFDPLIDELSQRYGLNDRGRDLFGLLMAYMHNDRRGGFGGFIESFREQGHGDLLASWLGNAQASGLNASDVGTVFGQGLLNDWASRLGVSRATVAAAIAGVLPRMVAAMTPGGRIPRGFAPTPAAIADHPRATAQVAPQIEPEVRLLDREDNVGVRPDVQGLMAGAARYNNGTAPNFERDAPSTRGEAERQTPMWSDYPDNKSARDASNFFAPPDRNTYREPAAADRSDANASYGGPSSARDNLTSVASPPSRQEPAFPKSAPETTGAVRTPAEAYAARNHSEQRIADMTAAFSTRPRSDGTNSKMRADARPEGWRPAVHPPRKRSWAWLIVLILLLAIIAGGTWYAWTLGLLDTYIQHYQLPIQTSPASNYGAD